MQFIDHGGILAKMCFVLLSIMLFASVYLTLIKAINLSGRAYRARKFLRGLARVRSLQQGQALVTRRPKNESFSRLTHRIMVEKKQLDATSNPYTKGSGVYDTMVQRLIAAEAAEQAADLHQGLKVLAAIVWAAPLTGLVAIAWRAGWLGPASAQAQATAGGVWLDAPALMQLGLLVSAIALFAYLCLLGANRIYLSRFVLFGRLILPLLEQGAQVKMREATSSSHGFVGVWQSAMDVEA